LGVATPDGALTATAAAGSRLLLTATGLAPGSSVTFVAYSTPTILGTATADGAGVAALSVTLPAGLPTGLHTVAAFGTAPDGSSRTLTAGLTITPALAGSPPRLAFTGVDLKPLLAAGVTLLALGGAALLTTRRRQPDRVPHR
jgi:hypothetical protein